MENVTANTIIRSWNRANILPSTMSTGNNLDSTSEERELETEIVNLIEQLPIDDPLEAREFVEIDDFMGVEERVTVDDIIEVMNEQGGCESEEDREMEVKTNDAIIGLDNVVKYIQQNNLGISVINERSKKLIIYKSIEKKKQVTLEKFVESSLQK